MNAAVLPGWMLRKLRHDAELGERFVLLVMNRTTAGLPFEIWPGANEELSAVEACASAAALGISPGAFADALERARRAFDLPLTPDLWSVGLTAGRRGTSSRPAGA